MKEKEKEVFPYRLICSKNVMKNTYFTSWKCYFHVYTQHVVLGIDRVVSGTRNVLTAQAKSVQIVRP